MGGKSLRHSICKTDTCQSDRNPQFSFTITVVNAIVLAVEELANTEQIFLLNIGCVLNSKLNLFINWKNRLDWKIRGLGATRDCPYWRVKMKKQKALYLELQQYEKNCIGEQHDPWVGTASLSRLVSE